MAYNFLFANNATTTLAQAISATATVITVASGEGSLFPSPSSGEAFAITLVDAATGLTNEICYCTSRSGDELTVVRGQEGKNAVAWSAGDTCANYITAGVFATWLNTAVANDQYVKQGGQAAFGNNAVYLGWRTDGTGLGIVIDTTSEGTIAVTGVGRLAAGGWVEQYYTLASGGNRTVSLTFNAPSAGYVHVVGSANFAVQNTNQSQLSIAVNGTTLSADNVTGSTAMTNHSCVAVSAGSVTVGSFLSTSATNPPNVGHTLSYIFVPS